MAKKIPFPEMVRRAKNTRSSLPKEVTMEKTMLPNGKIAYIFRHDKLGDLGRMFILGAAGDQSQFCFEVAGEPDDPMTEKRKEILIPISNEIIANMERIGGKGVGEVEPYESYKEECQVDVKIMRCKKCNTPVAQMIIAGEETTVDGLEDYARIVFPKLKELNVPAWVVGLETEIIVDGKPAGEALSIKVWPKREKARVICSTQLNPQFEVLENTHC